MSSSSVQVDGEMSPEFARLDLCARHMTKKWRGTAPPGRAVLRPERQCGKKHRSEPPQIVKATDRRLPDHGLTGSYVLLIPALRLCAGRTLLQKIHDRRFSVGRIRRRIFVYLPRVPSGLSPVRRHPFSDRLVRLVHAI